MFKRTAQVLVAAGSLCLVASICAAVTFAADLPSSSGTLVTTVAPAPSTNSAAPTTAQRQTLQNYAAANPAQFSLSTAGKTSSAAEQHFNNFLIGEMCTFASNDCDDELTQYYGARQLALQAAESIVAEARTGKGIIGLTDSSVMALLAEATAAKDAAVACVNGVYTRYALDPCSESKRDEVINDLTTRLATTSTTVTNSLSDAKVIPLHSSRQK